MEASKEILILSPIGRIKWLQAPEDFNEILVNLARTFNAPEMAMKLIDTNFSNEVTQKDYGNLLKCDMDIILKLEVDYELKNLLEGASGPGKIARDPVPSLENNPVASFFKAVDKKETQSISSEKSDKNSDVFDRNFDRSDSRRGTARGAARPSRANRGKRGGAPEMSEEEKKMQAAIQTLLDCGFTDTAKCRAALVKTNLNIEDAIDILTS